MPFMFFSHFHLHQSGSRPALVKSIKFDLEAINTFMRLVSEVSGAHMIAGRYVWTTMWVCTQIPARPAFQCHLPKPASHREDKGRKALCLSSSPTLMSHNSAIVCPPVTFAVTFSKSLRPHASFHIPVCVCLAPLTPHITSGTRLVDWFLE